jgi:hypothetical protein
MRTWSPAPAAWRLRARHSPNICQATMAIMAAISTPLMRSIVTTTLCAGRIGVRPVSTA